MGMDTSSPVANDYFGKGPFALDDQLDDVTAEVGKSCDGGEGS